MDEKPIVTRGRLGKKSSERSLISTLARSRKKVVNSCPRYDFDGKSTLLQQMADIMEEQVVAVQRPAVLQAAGEKPPTGGPEDQLPLDSEDRASLLQEAQRNN